MDYRPEGEFDAWMKRDPLQQARLRFEDMPGGSSEALDEVDIEVAAEMDEVRALAEQAPHPSVGSGPGEFKEAG